MAAVVAGAVKDYAWGMIDGMVPWTGRGTGKPQAELWFGVHPSGPSPVLGGGTAEVALADATVPLLVKILAAGHPLSIQIHPDAEQASAGFAAQPPGATTYSDSAEKTEMVVAMSQFQALAGWREPRRAASILASLGYPKAVQDAAAEGRWADTAGMIIQGLPEPGPWDPGRVRAALGTDNALEATALGDLAARYPDDPGVGVASILGFQALEPGQALYVPAGVPHAYLRGVSLEVMTSSDNVLRLGLTSKEIAIGDALRAIRADREPALLLATAGPKHPAGAPFAVTLQRTVSEVLPTGSYRVVLAVDGPVQVTLAGAATELAIGQAMLIPADDPTAVITSEAMVALVVAVGETQAREQ